MAIDMRLPGTLMGLVEAGQDLYALATEADDLARECAASLAAVERGLRRGEDLRPLLFEIAGTVRLADAGRLRILAGLRRYHREVQ